MKTHSSLFDRLNIAKDVENWDAVYADMLPKVYNYFCYRVGHGALAEDLTAITFEKAWCRRHRYQHNLGAFSTWLFTIARNTATDHYRKRREELSLDVTAAVSSGETVDETVQRRQDIAHLSKLFEQLPTRERELIALKYGAGLTNRKIARLTGLSETNVGSILYRVVRHLRAQWEHNNE